MRRVQRESDSLFSARSKVERMPLGQGCAAMHPDEQSKRKANHLVLEWPRSLCRPRICCPQRLIASSALASWPHASCHREAVAPVATPNWFWDRTGAPSVVEEHAFEPSPPIVTGSLSPLGARTKADVWACEVVTQGVWFLRAVPLERANAGRVSPKPPRVAPVSLSQ